MEKVLRRLGWSALALVIVGALVYVWIGFEVYTSFGPRDPPDTVIEPSTIGVVSDVMRRDGILHLRLDGSPTALDPDAHLVLAEPHENELLMMGDHDGRPWYLAIHAPEPAYPPGCYWMGKRAWNEPDAILFEVGGDYASGRLGLRLPKATGFFVHSSPPYPEGVYSNTDVFCVNPGGEVLGTVDGLRRDP